ncbi:heme exporter protein CcmD [Aliikangiella sp. IMCC44359]|uniref:heme exporter protein CcmD n=1 Tax=Aliikangiella sp. IMCC44359 TaxID=3459125 RepID=UPI00403A9245
MFYFDSIGDFLAMGGHAFYVWLSFAIVFIALVVQFFTAKNGVASSINQIKQHYRQLERRKASQVSVSAEQSVSHLEKSSEENE